MYNLSFYRLPGTVYSMVQYMVSVKRKKIWSLKNEVDELSHFDVEMPIPPAPHLLEGTTQKLVSRRRQNRPVHLLFHTA